MCLTRCNKLLLLSVLSPSSAEAITVFPSLKAKKTYSCHCRPTIPTEAERSFLVQTETASLFCGEHLERMHGKRNEKSKTR